MLLFNRYVCLLPAGPKAFMGMAIVSTLATAPILLAMSGGNSATGGAGESNTVSPPSAISLMLTTYQQATKGKSEIPAALISRIKIKTLESIKNNSNRIKSKTRIESLLKLHPVLVASNHFRLTPRIYLRNPSP